MTQEEQVKKRFLELYYRAERNRYYTFTTFLGLSEMSMLQQLICSPNGISKASVNYSEMNENHERQIVAFGCADDFGYDPEFPIRCICVRPKQQKFAENLSHRDFLGALMNLGIERETIGDIIIQDNVGYIMC